MISFGQNVNIPDANFKAYLVGEPLINTNGDSEIQVSEANSFTGTIDCNNPNISDLTGIEAFTALNILAVVNGQLTSLDVSNNVALTELKCYGNQLTQLDVSSNSNLTFLACSNNQLECLNVKNGNNIAFTIFVVSGNQNLTCIEVDDVNYSTANWINIDPQMSFSTNCNNNGCSCDTYSSIIEIGLDSYTSPSGTVYTSEGFYTDTIQNAAGCDSIISIALAMQYTGIGELHNTPKQLVKIVDLLGRETPFKPNTPLLYIYNDGTVERKMIIKE